MIKNFLFDLDNTIYPSSSKINEGIDHRMVEAVSEFLQVDMNTAAILRHEKKKNYSSTLEWLMKEQNFTDVDWYLQKVHPEDELNELSPVSGLKDFFEGLKSSGYRMAILTNGPAFHASRVLDFYGIFSYFDGIHDIVENGMQGKPYANSYFNAMKKENFELCNTLFIDDYLKYVYGYMDLGGTAVLIDADGSYTQKANFSKYLKLYCLHSIFELPSLCEDIEQK